ncbi:MAG TPA: 50S ribosomal protein L6 [Thermoplasmata archaeon]|nr:50S ribosomal protein L6 [Thermoplasmata archaeon]
MPKVSEIRYAVGLPEGVTATLEGNDLTIQGPLGALIRTFRHPRLGLVVEDGSVVVAVDLPRRRDQALAGTWRAHIANMVRGVTEGFTYRLKVRYSHFPMKLSVRGKELVIENFMGERHPRTADIIEDTTVEIRGDEVVVTGIDKEHTGQTAANIEQATRIKNYDPKVFQDGIYIVEKG